MRPSVVNLGSVDARSICAIQHSTAASTPSDISAAIALTNSVVAIVELNKSLPTLPVSWKIDY